MSDSVRPHRRQPTRLPCPWDSPGKNTEVGCHCLLQCMKVKSAREVAQSCPTLSMDCSPPGSSIRGILQAGGLEWGATAFSDAEKRSPQMACVGFVTERKPQDRWWEPVKACKARMSSSSVHAQAQYQWVAGAHLLHTRFSKPQVSR